MLGAAHEVIVAARGRRPKLDDEGTLRGERHTSVREARWPSGVGRHEQPDTAQAPSLSVENR
jgi:hypothetical protein